MQEHSEQTKLIQEFVRQYQQKFDFFEKVSAIAADKLRSGLKRAGVRCIVTNRAKNPQKLLDKLEKRCKIKAYRNDEEIENDIVDFSGVRVALYFPNDKQEVDKVIRGSFLLDEELDFPESSEELKDRVGVDFGYKKQFTGYHARHYRVRLAENDDDNLSRYCNALIEIQVASVLMHAWSEVEHDLVYKPTLGHLSAQELSVLDEINGLVLVGELALNGLKNAIEERVKADEFNNHYELASYILRSSKDTQVNVGDVEMLFLLLQKINQQKPSWLSPFVARLDFRSKKPLVEQIVASIVNEHPELQKEVASLTEASAQTADRGASGKIQLLNEVNQEWSQFLKGLDSPTSQPALIASISSLSVGPQTRDAASKLLGTMAELKNTPHHQLRMKHLEGVLAEIKSVRKELAKAGNGQNHK